MRKNYSNTEEIKKYSNMACANNKIEQELYTKYEVKRGLRDISGKGVLAGLTEISEIVSYIIEDMEMIPCDGKLYYRGYNIEDIVNEFTDKTVFGFEEVTYLLLYGELPDETEYKRFVEILGDMRKLPYTFVRNGIMNLPGKDMMNMLSRGILGLYVYDDNADDISVENVVRQSMELISKIPVLMCYCYQAYNHMYNNKSLVIHEPDPLKSTSENILMLLRADGKYTPLEAKILDLILMLHAEHGGGNNSSFTTHVVTSSATDTYSSVSASLGSLKGPRHGGANIKVTEMMENIKENVPDYKDADKIKDYIIKILDKEAFDKSGLVYGVGHAVYSISDPRAVILKKFAKKLAEEKKMEDEFYFYELVEKKSIEAIMEKRKIYKGVCINIDFYSGFVYKLLDIPEELFTPLFATARISGWCAHRIEEIVNAGKIIRPAYKSVSKRKEYKSMKDR